MWLLVWGLFIAGLIVLVKRAGSDALAYFFLGLLLITAGCSVGGLILDFIKLNR